ncbi:MAG: hybrid sensor histidine kinase/response regulator, partial [Deltaproteobacteria bacterium]
GMMGYAQLAQMTQAEEDYRKCVEVVVRSSKRAGEITAGLLSIARRDSGKVEETSLSSVLQEPLALMKRDLEKQKITVHLEFESDPLLVTSVGKLQQVFIALIRNAIDAMPRGGDLIFRSRRIDDQLEIRVIDTGEGISEENLAMLFSPFFTTKGSLGGSSLPGKGLDLAVSFAIMESLKGSIRAESTLGKGTTFILTLPLMLSGEILPQIGSRSHPTTPIPKSSPKVGDILIIDDEETVLGMLKKSLELDQHRVVTTQNGLKALEYAEIHHFDLAVIDVRMPIINGWETLERLKTIDPAIKAIIMSANPGDQPIEEMIEKSRQLGAQRYIRKPFDLREFKRIVSEVLAS